jgi:lipopolysaccharide biosynthesis regulator YciM
VNSTWAIALVVLALAGGWFAAKRDSFRRSRQEVLRLPTAYFRGLNFLLNEQPDKAIEMFVKVLEVDAETAELHLAVGNLFRRRGELERATRVHQNLVARQNLDAQTREHALYELAQDYFKAGLYDRAENLFQEVADSAHYGEYALRFLSQIYEQEKDWDRAIAMMRRRAQYLQFDPGPVIAQYYCELAEAALASGETRTASAHLDTATQEDPGCTRASLLRGDVAARLGDHESAIRHWRSAAGADPRLFREVAEKVVSAQRAIGRDSEIEPFLAAATSRNDDARLMQIRVRELRRTHGDATAEEFLSRHLLERPSLFGFREYVEMCAQRNGDGRCGDALPVLAAVKSLIRDTAGYRCNNCGFEGRSMHWHCPSCKRWATIEPVNDAGIQAPATPRPSAA